MTLGYNELTGSVPKSFGNLENLFDLELQNNYLTSAPDHLGNCSRLSSLSLGFNRLSG